MGKKMLLGLVVLFLFGGLVAQGADQKEAEAISEYGHICEAASRISIQLIIMLAKHPYEDVLAGYAEKIAEANVYVFKRLRCPPGAEAVKEHFGKAVLAFEKAVALHRKGKYKESDEAGTECKTEFWAAVAEVQKLRKDGVIP